MPAGYLKEQFESIPGNESNAPTLSTKIMYPAIQEFELDPGTEHLERDDELGGGEEPRSLLAERYAPTWNMSSRMYPDLIGWRLKHILGPPTTTAGDGIITGPDAVAIPTGAYRHVWVSTSANWGNPGQSPLTAEMIAAYKDQGEFFRIKGAACAELGIETPETGGATLSASGPALYVNDQLADPALTAAYETAKPFTRGGLSLPTWLTGTGTHEDFSFQVASPAEAVATLGTASKWPDTMEKGAEDLLTVTGSLAQRQLDPQDIEALRQATAFAIMARWVNDDNAVGSYKHTLWLEGNAQYTTGTPGALANRRRIGAQFEFKLTKPTSGAATTITLVNDVANYS